MSLGIAGPRAPIGRYGEPVVPNLNVRHLCPNCRTDPPNIIEEYSKGDLVCADCGTILGDRIVDTRSEWRTFAGDEGGDDPSRVGDAGNPLLGGNLDTVISARDGRTGLSRDLQRAQAKGNAQQTSGRTTDLRMLAIFAQITERCNILGIPGIAQRAQHSYQIIDEKMEIKPREENVYIGACISFATRGVPDANRTLVEIGTALGLQKKPLGKALIRVKGIVHDKLSEMKRGGQDTSGVASMNDSVEGLMGRYLGGLGLSNAAHNIAKQVSTINSAKGWSEGRAYQSVASGIVWFVITLMQLEGPNATLKEVAKVSGISEATIKLVRKNLAVKATELVRPEWQAQYAKGFNILKTLGQAAVNDAAQKANSSHGGSPAPIDSPSPAGNEPQADAAPIDGLPTKNKRPPSPLGQNSTLPTPTVA